MWTHSRPSAAQSWTLPSKNKPPWAFSKGGSFYCLRRVSFLFRQERHERSRPRGDASSRSRRRSPWIPQARRFRCGETFYGKPLPHRNILHSYEVALREGYIGEGACSCGSKISAPPLCRILWVLSWRSKKVPPLPGREKKSSPFAYSVVQ